MVDITSFFEDSSLPEMKLTLERGRCIIKGVPSVHTFESLNYRRYISGPRFLSSEFGDEILLHVTIFGESFDAFTNVNITGCRVVLVI